MSPGAEVIEMVDGQQFVLVLFNGTLTSARADDDRVADVTILDGRSALVQGIGPGETTIRLTGSSGRRQQMVISVVPQE
jgi:hypothetical protein